MKPMCKDTLKQLLKIISKHEDVDGQEISGAMTVGFIIQDIIDDEFDEACLTSKRKTPININPEQHQIYANYYNSGVYEFAHQAGRDSMRKQNENIIKQ